MGNKKLVITFITSSFMLALMFFSVLFIYDPLKIFHKPWQYKEYLVGNMRQQAAGIINNWEYDSIIIGTSMLENTSSKEASKKLGGKFINISLSGSDFFERAIVINHALQKKKIQKILFSLDYVHFNLVRKGMKAPNQPTTWDYLYDNNPFNDFKAYINNRYLKCLFLTSSKKECMGRKVDFDRPHAWYKRKGNYERFGGIDNWFEANNNSQVKKRFNWWLNMIKEIKLGNKNIDKNLNENIIKSQNYIDDTLIKLISNYPQTEFILILPPHSTLRYALEAQFNVSAFERFKASLKYLVSKSDIYPNLKIFGWGNYAFTDDIANYKDLTHYEYKINSWMLGAIKKNEGLLTTKNIDNYLNLFTQKSLQYDVTKFGKKIEKYLQSNQKK